MNAEEPHHGHLGSDPIARSFQETPAFNEAWLSKSRSQTATQRIGFAVLSTLMMLGGVVFLRAGMSFWWDTLLAALPLLLLGAFMVWVGLRGLWKLVADLFLNQS